MSGNDVLSRMMQASGLKTGSSLAEALGVSPQAISNYRKRGAIPSSLVLKFSEKFEVSLDWLVKGNGGPRVDPYRAAPDRHSVCAEASPEELVCIGKMLTIFRRENQVFAIAVKSAIEVFYAHIP
ncbi:MAG: helix-turn-helix domain-containing protein [Deltaproteobacteria bacterium]|nr:helix-turn-helix domain-containing protein [Deltaproteobacteria bacterium]MBZ0219960.1 helix-turn-helix domain containing protein [Deltaproteobacteria bacterium]